ncbi:MAG: hypothetical protein J3Q66DRAFT_328462 [Benniella sp.]|nr:MAG: hypothetical protein J3Q66DRAFT_328462 [Benniella sp.]
MVESVSEDAAFLAKSNLVSQRLEYIIGYSLDQCQFRNAVFLAERLVSHLRSPGHSEAQREYAQYLLATSHYRQGKPEAAWAVLEGCKTSRCRYLFAQCCLDLRRYVECNGVLEFLLEDTDLAKCPTADVLSGRHASSIGDPDRSSVLSLMGQTARAQQRHKLAIKYFKEALEENPFLWEAFENLCELGVPPDPNDLFSQFDTGTGNLFPKLLLHFPRPKTVETPFFSIPKGILDQDDMQLDSADPKDILSKIPKRGSLDTDKPKPFLPSMSSIQSMLAQASESGMIESDYSTLDDPNNPFGPSTNREPATNSVPTDSDTVHCRRGVTARRHIEKTKSNASILGPKSSGGITKKAASKSASDANASTSSQFRGTKGKNPAKTGASLGVEKDSPDNGERGQHKEQTATTTAPSSTGQEIMAEKEGLRIVADVLRIMARGYGLLALNKFTEAFSEFERLPYEHLESSWAQCQLAKCKFETQDYASAARYFEHARELEPNLQRDMEIYSSCLWQLKKEMALSTLAKELKDADHQSPQAWVALGNAYNMKHESAQALKCFKRATQLNDRFAYAHTLSGLEYNELEEYDKAQTEFRTAMSIDPRHYNAWYGMGVAYSKMGKHDLALIHVKEAHRLNSSNSVLLYNVGTIQEKMNRTTEALRSFEQAIELDPSHVAARFRKAHIQLDMGQYGESLKELEAIAKLSPDEASVFTLQGRVLLKMGNKEQALKYFTWALNLDSKSSHTIRDLIEKVNQGSSNGREGYEATWETLKNANAKGSTSY